MAARPDPEQRCGRCLVKRKLHQTRGHDFTTDIYSAVCDDGRKHQLCRLEVCRCFCHRPGFVRQQTKAVN